MHTSLFFCLLIFVLHRGHHLFFCTFMPCFLPQRLLHPQKWDTFLSVDLEINKVLYKLPSTWFPPAAAQVTVSPVQTVGS